jgi:Tfp pilus assembly protein PilX
MRKSAARGARRGIALVTVLFLVVVLILVAVVVLSMTSNSASDTLAVQTKNQTFNAAEAGLNYAQWSLDQNLAAPASGGTGSVGGSGYKYIWAILANQIYQARSRTVADQTRFTGRSAYPPAWHCSPAGLRLPWAAAPCTWKRSWRLRRRQT